MTTINTNSPNRSYTITGVNNDVTYKVRVAAVNSIGTGPFTEYVFATPSLFAIDNDFYNVELLLNMDQTSNSDNFYGNSSLILGTPGLDQNDDQYSVQTKLLLHGDGIAIVDSSLNPKSISRVNNPYTVSDSRFGTGSIRFTGNNYLSMGSSNDFNVGTGDFTVELFIKFKSFNTTNPICNSTNDINGADSGKWYITYTPSTGLLLGRHSVGTSATTSWSAAIDTWYHLALVRDSGTIRIFIDGVEQSVTDATIFNNVSFNQSGFLVGRITSWSGLDAQIDEFRFTKGVARNITVPTVAYSNPTSPFKDLSSNSKNVIVIGQPLISSYNDSTLVAPTNIVASQQQGGAFRLDWDFAFPLLVDYIVQYSDDGGISWNTVNDGVSTNNNVTINLADGFYIFKIAATNSLGQGPWSDTVDVTLPLPVSVEYLVVAGGGGGGNDMGGGGGAGGLITNVAGASSGGGSTAEPTLYLENIDTLNIVVGAGGSGAASGSGGSGTNGGNSTIATTSRNLVTAIGGGFGASKHNSNAWNANNGGSGGGGSGGRQSSSSYGGLPGNGTTKQGFNGAGSGYTWYPGGGGGAGGAGIGDGSVRGHGGPGVLSRILGMAYYWAGGGGGSGYSTTGGDGGIGGGGGGAAGTTTGGAGINNGFAGGGGCTGCQANTPGGNGGNNTGGGGGGGSHFNSNNYGGSGGSGAVILRSLTSATSTTGSPTVSADGLYNVYMFTGTGSITFPSTPKAPPPPKNIMNIQNTQGDLILSWDAVASSYNVTDYVVEYRSSSGSSWTTVSDGVSSSTGATISGLALGNYVFRVAAVNSVGQGPWRAKFITVFSSEGSGVPINVQYLVVGGGGGGNTAGGGGAGGVLNSTVTTSGNIVISVGSGGSGGVNGGDSNLLVNSNNITAIGGGYGGPIVDAYITDAARGGDGGSGGGVGSGWAGSSSRRGYGTVGQGYDGGSYSGGASYNGAGGGGAGGVGTNGSYSSPGSGGIGRAFSISGTNTYYAGGGGGGGISLAWGPWNGNGRVGGQGGGGNGDIYSADGYPYTGSSSSRTGSAGTPNTGGGGGGANSSGYAGGSGVVIIRAPRSAVIATGSPTVTIVGNDIVYTFTGSGSIIF
jgi:hypothetical protein